LISIDAVTAAMNVFGITWEFSAFNLMWHASKICPSVLTRGNFLEMDNMLHGMQYWFIVEHLFVRCATEFNMSIPGLSTSDGVGVEKSSCGKVHDLAVRKIAEMTAACVKIGIPVPVLDKWFFQETIFSEDDDTSAGGDDAGDSVGAMAQELEDEDSGNESDGSDNENSGDERSQSGDGEDGLNNSDVELEPRRGGRDRGVAAGKKKARRG